MPTLSQRLALVAMSMLPAWLLVALLLAVWSPVLEHLNAWQEAAVIAPQVVIFMGLIVNPLLQQILTFIKTKK